MRPSYVDEVCVAQPLVVQNVSLLPPPLVLQAFSYLLEHGNQSLKIPRKNLGQILSMTEADPHLWAFLVYHEIISSEHIEPLMEAELFAQVKLEWEQMRHKSAHSTKLGKRTREEL